MTVLLVKSGIYTPQTPVCLGILPNTVKTRPLFYTTARAGMASIRAAQTQTAGVHQEEIAYMSVAPLMGIAIQQKKIVYQAAAALQAVAAKLAAALLVPILAK